MHILSATSAHFIRYLWFMPSLGVHSRWVRPLKCFFLNFLWVCARTTDTQWRHKSKISEKLGRCGRQNMLRPYLKIWDWDWIFGRAVKAISSLGVRSPWLQVYGRFYVKTKNSTFDFNIFWPYSVCKSSSCCTLGPEQHKGLWQFRRNLEYPIIPFSA